jgi:hypothetical protein
MRPFTTTTWWCGASATMAGILSISSPVQCKVWSISLGLPAGELSDPRGKPCGHTVFLGEGTEMREFEAELEAAIDAAGRRNIANWDEFGEYERLQVRGALRQLALEWLRGKACGHSEDTAGNARPLAA